MFPPLDADGKFEYQGKWLYSLAGHPAVADRHYTITPHDLNTLSKDTYSIYERAIYHVWHDFLRGRDGVVKAAIQIEETQQESETGVGVEVGAMGGDAVDDDDEDDNDNEEYEADEVDDITETD